MCLLQGILHPGWSDSQHNLWQHTWHVAHKLSSNLTPHMLSPAMNPNRQPHHQQQQGLAGLPSLPQVQPGLAQLPPQLLQQQQQQLMPQHMLQQQVGPTADAAAGVLGADGNVQQQLQQAAH